jgi:F-type H+-transporting ATPase subunit b
MPTTTLAASNFLVPNGTFIAELVAFAIILFVVARYIIPPINNALAERQEAIRRQFEESQEARARAEQAEAEFRAALSDARQEAARIREEAREHGAAIIAEMREQAGAESQRILAHAHSQLEAERQQIMHQMRTEVGSIATTLAERILGESLEDDDRQSRTVDRFIAELESQDEASQATNTSGAR